MSATRTHTSHFIAALLCVVAMTMSACHNPIDMDDTHNSVVNPKPVVLNADSVEMSSVEGTDSDDALRRTFRLETGLNADSTDKFLCLVDTSGVIPKLTLHATLVPTGQYLRIDSYAMQRVSIKLDSVPIDGDKVVHLRNGEIKAVVLAFTREQHDRIITVLDTISLQLEDDYNYAILSQNVIGAKRAIRLGLNLQMLSNSKLDDKRRLARLQAVARLRY